MEVGEIAPHLFHDVCRPDASCALFDQPTSKCLFGRVWSRFLSRHSFQNEIITIVRIWFCRGQLLLLNGRYKLPEEEYQWLNKKWWLAGD